MLVGILALPDARLFLMSIIEAQRLEHERQRGVGVLPVFSPSLTLFATAALQAPEIYF
jgi:hypothetical protein